MPTFKATESRSEAMTMRGVRFYSKDYLRYTSNKLLASGNYRVEIPLYNASFQNANGVKVNLYWTTSDEDPKASKTFIGTSGAVNMTGWSDDGTNEANNKAWAKIDFTPNKTITKDGNYYLYAEIEYSGDEVHKRKEDENAKILDIGGNNQGYFGFSVGATSTATNASFVAASEEVNWEELLEQVKFPTETYNDTTTWVDFFNKYVKETTGSFTMKVTLTNEMDYTIPDGYFGAFFFDQELWEEEGVAYTSAPFVKHMPLFPHETYSFEVTVDAETADRMRAAGLGNTWCTYKTCKGYANIVYEAIYGHPYRGEIPDGDTPPEIEDSGEDVPDDIIEDEETKDDETNNTLSSSGGDCDAGISVSGLGILLSVLIIRRKTR